MKKMICEICGSQSIRKENDIFKCQECGTEYSLDEAKKLLKEINSSTSQTSISDVDNESKSDEKEKLIAALRAWASYIDSFRDCEDWFIPDGGITTPEFWSMDHNKLLDQPIHIKSKLLNSDFLNFKNDNNRGDYSPNYFKDLLPKLTLFYATVGQDKEVFKLYDFLSGHRKDFDTYYGINNLYDLSTLDGLHSIKTKDIDISEAVLKLIEVVDDNSRFKITKTETETTTSGIFFQKTQTITKTTILNCSNDLSSIVESLLHKRMLIKELHSRKYQYLAEHHKEMLQNYVDLLNQESLFVDMFDLPIRFRDVKIISAVIELLEDGRAETWKEAINLYKEEEYRAKTLAGLSSIGNSLLAINSTIISGFSYVGNKLTNINCSIQETSKKVSQLVHYSSENNQALKQIMFDTRYSLIRQII